VLSEQVIKLGGEVVLKNVRIKDFAMGFITYFIVSIILDLFGLNTEIVRFMVFLIIVLLGYFITSLYNKKRS